ncbi:hypothetical protein [Roseomonas sp. BN140053]|uniref:hypothetical protein n=1 Tax=Roseomonas sp. BN140053 TaxID=3391898 RepID=UPI0039EB42CD
MADTKPRSGKKVPQTIQEELLDVLAEVPAALREAHDRSKAAREQHAKRVEESREWIRGGSRPLKGRFRL